MDQLIHFFISNAYAQTPGSESAMQGGLSLFWMMAILFGFMYFFIIRPQNKRAKQQQTMLNSLAKGDEIITAGGLLGRVTQLSDQYMTVSIANNIEVVMQKSAVVNVLPKGTLKSME